MRAVQMLLILALVTTMTHGLDTCITNGVLRPVQRLRITNLQPEKVVLDAVNFQNYLQQISLDSPRFLDGLESISTIDKINQLQTWPVSSPSLKKFSGKFNAMLVESSWGEALKSCSDRHGRLLNFDYPTTRVATLKFMQENSISSLPLESKSSKPYISTSDGEVLVYDPTMDRAVATAAIFPTFSKNDKITIEAAPTGSSTILCLVPIRPILNQVGRNTYKKSLARIASRLALLVRTFVSGYEKFDALSKVLPPADVTGVTRILASPKFNLIDLAKYFSTHQFVESFKNMDFNDLKQLSGLKETFSKLIKLFKPQTEKFTLPKEVLELDESFTNITITGKSVDSEGNILYYGTGLRDQTEKNFPIVYYKFLPFNNNVKSLKEVFLIAKGEDSLKSGNLVYTLDNYRPIGSDCRDMDLIHYCNRYTPGRITDKQINCAKFILGLSQINDCEIKDSHVTAIRTDCNLDPNLGPPTKVIVSTPESINIEVKCNDENFETHSLAPGIHELNTQCAVHFQGDILAPQVIRNAELQSIAKITGGTDLLAKDLEYAVLMKYVLPLGGLMALLVFICSICLCAFINFQRCKELWCCCCKRNDFEPSAPNLDLGNIKRLTLTNIENNDLSESAPSLKSYKSNKSNVSRYA